MLGAILGGASLLGGLFGGAGRGAAQERQNQNDFLQRENQLKASLYGTQQGALLNLLGLNESALMNRSRLGLDAPEQRTRQALLGSILSRLQPTRIQAPAGINVPQISGGLSGALGGFGGRAAGNELQRQALMALLTKSDVPSPVDYTQQGMLPSPQMAAYKKAGKGESILSLLGLGGALAGGVRGMLPQRSAGGSPGVNLGIGAF